MASEVLTKLPTYYYLVQLPGIADVNQSVSTRPSLLSQQVVADRN